MTASDPVLIGGLIVFSALATATMIIAYLVTSASLVKPRTPHLNLKRPTERFAFAAVDITNHDEDLIAREASDAARKVEELLPFAAAIPDLARKIELNLVFPDGSNKHLQGRRDAVDLRFCIGNSVAGGGVSSGSLLAVIALEGKRLSPLVRAWREKGEWKAGAILEADGFHIDLERNTVRWPSGVVLSRGNLISLEMPHRMYEIYLRAIKERASLAEALGAEFNNSLFNKIRIFGGILFDGDRAPLLETFRFPDKAERAVASKRHTVDQLNGLVAGSWPQDVWATWLPPTKASSATT